MKLASLLRMTSWELLNGEIVYMSPGKNPHIGCVNKLNAFLNRRIGHKAIISVQNPIGLGEYSEPEPDLAVCRLKDDFYSTEKARPEEIYLIIEVADTSLQKDREIKLPDLCPGRHSYLLDCQSYRQAGGSLFPSGRGTLQTQRVKNPER